MNVNDLLDLVSKGGWTVYVGLTFMFFIALYRGLLRFRREVLDQISERDKKYDEMRGDRDYWRAIAQQAVGSLEQLTAVMEAGQNRIGVQR